MSKFEELVEKLSELFELDKADLDFGIHRIIKTKHQQISEYLNKRLPAKVQEVLGEMAEAEAGESLAELRRQITATLGASAFADGDSTLNPQFADTPLGRQYARAVEASQSAANAERDEAEVYSHLYEFFSRYYEDGDFITRRRRTADKETYAIPYDGQEVVLHWANKDQYYIKSSEDLKDYTFTVPADVSGSRPARVHFKLTRMDPVPNNNKATRIFQLDEEAEIQATDEGLVIPFHFAEGKKRTKTEEAEWEQAVLEALPKEWQARLARPDETYTGEGERTILQKHLRHYTKKNTSDYFIHKDLGGFLRRELDFYIKNEVMYLDDVDSRPADYLEKELRKIKAIRQVAHDLIDFLAQFEDFQKRLWLKKKFVIETHWCITLDRVPEALYPEIAANDKQREEWVRLFAIDEIKAEKLGDVAYSEPLSVGFLEANDKLVLDTAFFPPEFKYRLLASIDDIDAQTDGLLVHSENFQALNLLRERLKGALESIYIDPPYNTGPTEIIYKNAYKDSSWLSLMADRLAVSLAMLQPKGCYAIAIDDYEMVHLCECVDALFADYDRNMVVVNHHPQGGMGHNISRTHEYMVIMTPRGQDILQGKAKSGETEYRSFMLSGPGDNKSRRGRPNSFYALLVDEDKRKVVGVEPPPALEDEYPTGPTPEGYARRYPIGPSGDEKVWCRAYESAVQAVANGEITVTDSGTIKLAVDTSDKRKNLMSNWTDSRYNAGPHGTALVANILGTRDAFSYPKSVYTVIDAVEAMTYLHDAPTIMDFFAGSGTTAHAVIDLNRGDDGDRKYILVEMGEYFDTATKPRVLKVVYSSGWSDGKPMSRDTGISHCFKYLRLESYEDTLNNLELEDRSADLLGLSERVAEDYLLRYALDVESRSSLLGLERFEDPFNCRLKIYNRQTGAAGPTLIDLPETFNYLLGLRVRTMQMRDGFLVIEGENPAAETVLVIWRNVKEKDNAALERFVTKTLRINPADTEYAAIYINGDTTLDDPHKKVLLTEQVFHELMFDVRGL